MISLNKKLAGLAVALGTVTLLTSTALTAAPSTRSCVGGCKITGCYLTGIEGGVTVFTAVRFDTQEEWDAACDAWVHDGIIPSET